MSIFFYLFFLLADLVKLAAAINLHFFPTRYSFFEATLTKSVWAFRRPDDYNFPTSPFAILEPQNMWIHEFHVVQERRATNFKAPKLWKGSSGYDWFTFFSLSHSFSFCSELVAFAIFERQLICLRGHRPTDLFFINFNTRFFLA